MFEKKQTDVNELMVLDSLVEACKATIAGYPTTVRTGDKRGQTGGSTTAVVVMPDFSKLRLLLTP